MNAFNKQYKHKSKRLNQLLRYAKANYKAWTKPERLMNGWLSNWGLKHSNQCIIEPYIVDILLLEYKIVIELDGIQHSANTVYDAKRTLYLLEQGYKVIRFDNSELYNKELVKEKLFEFIYETNLCPNQTK